MSEQPNTTPVAVPIQTYQLAAVSLRETPRPATAPRGLNPSSR